jgi:hypothetical protein
VLDAVQREAFGYFLHEGNAQNGLIADKTSPGSPASIAAVGFALSAYPVSVERKWLSRADASARALATLRFFNASVQSSGPDASGYNGFYYHFLDMQSGRRVWDCELSTIDSAILFAGMLTAAAYFSHESDEEREIRTLANRLYRRADWNWARNGGATVTHGWKPGTGFLKYRWEGYCEALILYLLGLGSPTHPLPAESYKRWMETYTWRNIYDQAFVYAGPLFIHQFSHIWIDFRGIRDDYMRDKRSDYFENSRRATLAQRQYAIANLSRFVGYGADCWGIPASDGPGPARYTTRGEQRRYFGYLARGAPDGPDDGTLAPWAVAASLPFAPEVVGPALRHFEALNLRENNPFDFDTTFNATIAERSGLSEPWVSPFHFGINQGPVILMIENHRTGFVWDIMRNCPYLVDGLRRAGFSGGWLNGHPCSA